MSKTTPSYCPPCSHSLPATDPGSRARGGFSCTSTRFATGSAGSRPSPAVTCRRCPTGWTSSWRSRVRERLLDQCVGGGHPGVVLAAALEDPLLRGEVDEGQPESLGIPLGPLEVIQQRPGEVAADVRPVGDRVQHRAQVTPQV